MLQATRKLLVLAAPMPLILFLATPRAADNPHSMEDIMKRMAPVIFVEEVEPCVAFWVDRLGFEQTMEVPEGHRLGFAAVQSGRVEIMCQSRASLAKDIPALAEGPYTRSAALFIEVADLDALKPKLKGTTALFPERTTFYGAREIGVWATSGTPVVLAEMQEQG
jgi:uncharacterized glyoxalase superfamily protein PhnB